MLFFVTYIYFPTFICLKFIALNLTRFYDFTFLCRKNTVFENNSSPSLIKFFKEFIYILISIYGDKIVFFLQYEWNHC